MGNTERLNQNIQVCRLENQNKFKRYEAALEQRGCAQKETIAALNLKKDLH